MQKSQHRIHGFICQEQNLGSHRCCSGIWKSRDDGIRKKLELRFSKSYYFMSSISSHSGRVAQISFSSKRRLPLPLERGLTEESKPRLPLPLGEGWGEGELSQQVGEESKPPCDLSFSNPLITDSPVPFYVYPAYLIKLFDGENRRSWICHLTRINFNIGYEFTTSIEQFRPNFSTCGRYSRLSIRRSPR